MEAEAHRNLRKENLEDEMHEGPKVLPKIVMRATKARLYETR